MPDSIIKLLVFPIRSPAFSILRNLTAVRMIELNTKYLNQDKSPNPFDGSPNTIQKLNTCDDEEYQDKLKKILDEYLSSSKLTTDEKHFLNNQLNAETCLQDNLIVLYQSINGRTLRYLWSISLSEVFALVYLTLKDTDLSVWPPTPGSDLLAERGLRLHALNECIRTLHSSTNHLCQSSIASELFLLINGSENKTLPLSLSELINKTIHDYLVELLREYTGVHFNDDSDPKGEERCNLQLAFNSIFLPWLLSGQMPAKIMSFHISKGGASSLKLKIIHQLTFYGIHCFDTLLAPIDNYCNDESISQWPCTFMPVLATFHHWLNSYAQFFLLDPSSQGSNLKEKQVLSIIHLLRCYEAQWMEIIYLASKLFDMIIKYKELYYFNALDLIPNDQVKNDLIDSFAFIEDILSDTNGISGLIIESSYQSIIENQFFLFLHGYYQWRTLSHHDFILHFFHQWHSNDIENKLTVRSKLFIRMATLFFKEKNDKSNYLIYVPDFILSRWLAPEKMSTYQINRILLHAVNYFVNRWTPLFFSYFTALISYLPKTSHPVRNHLSQFLILRDIYLWKYLGTKKPVGASYSDIVISPQLQFSSLSIQLVDLLCQQPNQNKALIEQIFIHIPYFNPSNRNEFGNTPLIQAAEFGHYSLCKILIKHYPLLEETNLNGATALQVATKQGHYDICQLLIQSGVNINACNKQIASPLYIAVKNSYIKIVRLLLSHHANQTLANSRYYRPLDMAVINNDVLMVNEFITAGADLNQLNHHGQTPLHLAINENNIQLIDFLLVGQHVNLEQKNKRGHTPIWYAAKKARLPIVQKLVIAGASVIGQNQENENLAEFCSRIGRSRIHNYLLNKFTIFNKPREAKRQPSEQSSSFFASSSYEVEKESSPVKHQRI